MRPCRFCIHLPVPSAGHCFSAEATTHAYLANLAANDDALDDTMVTIPIIGTDRLTYPIDPAVVEALRQA